MKIFIADIKKQYIKKQYIKKQLISQKYGIAEKRKYVKENPNVVDDTEWMNDYINQQGWVEALEFVMDNINAMKERIKNDKDN